MDTLFRRPSGRFGFLQGFTLIELLLVVALLGVLVSTGTAGYQQWVAQQRSHTAMESLKRLLSYARGYALSHHQAVAVCARGEGGLCAASGNSWQQGALVFIDHSGSGSYNPAQDTLLRDIPLSSRLSITSNRGHLISFSNMGMGAQAAGRFCLGDPTRHSLVISFSGRMRTESHPGCAENDICPRC